MAKKRTSGTTPATTPTDTTTTARRRTTRRAAATASTPGAVDGMPVPDVVSVSTAAEMSPVAGTSVASAGSPSSDEIAVAAYHRYLQRGGQNGTDVDDWIAAEHELRQRSGR